MLPLSGGHEINEGAEASQELLSPTQKVMSSAVKYAGYYTANIKIFKCLHGDGKAFFEPYMPNSYTKNLFTLPSLSTHI